jgi:anti-sigma-K factor RskA
MATDRSNRCEELQPQLAAYALGEAEADPTLLAHLADCAACRDALRAYTQIARVLPYTAAQVTPPPELRARILAAATTSTPLGTQPQRVQRNIRPRWQSSVTLAWGCACVLLVMLVGWNVTLQRHLDAQTAQLDRLTAQVRASRENWQVMTQVLNTPDLRAYALSGSAATGRFWASPQSPVACLVAQGLRDPGANNVYQVWLMQGDTPVGAGTFVPQAGNGWILIPIDEPLASYQGVGITIEPRGGSEAPSGQPVLNGALAVSEQSSAFSRIEMNDFTPYTQLTD